MNTILEYRRCACISLSERYSSSERACVTLTCHWRVWHNKINRSNKGTSRYIRTMILIPDQNIFLFLICDSLFQFFFNAEVRVSIASRWLPILLFLIKESFPRYFYLYKGENDGSPFCIATLLSSTLLT